MRERISTGAADPYDSDSGSCYSSDDELDLGSRIEKHLRDERYICLICTCEVGHGDKFWSCGDCHRVYHIACISSWSLKGSSTDEEGRWKCPACHGTHHKQKFQHKCWCQKQLHPQPNPLHPGSCGQTCGAQLPGCPHKCALPCHPGPHAKCNALGPLLKCKCGRHENQWPCVITPYDEGWQCEEMCAGQMPCEMHKCSRVCHPGLCGRCEHFVESTCYCGKSKDMVKCFLRQPKQSYGEKKPDNWVGVFACSLTSGVTFDCGVHFVTKMCEPRARKSGHCPRSPDVLTMCPCGKTTIKELNNGEERDHCTDAVPTCGKTCGKKLKCGHECKWDCHEDDCSNCFETIKMKCQCGFNSFSVPCRFVQEGYRASCSRQCTALLSCRRHRCDKVCCAEEAAGLARERNRKKGIRNNTSQPMNGAFDVEASHICLQTCNKRLSCGNTDHTCHQTCHAGPCRPCLESSNDDLVCNCGKTVVMAPVRCGTTLPRCDHPCIRTQPCGHPPMPHNCHPDTQECSMCTYTVEKLCNCAKNVKSAMCHQVDVFCGQRCAKRLPCGHNCLMTCHRGPCVCKSICGITKKYCHHVDRQACHLPDPCKLPSVCNEMVKVKCKCGRIIREIPCGASEKAATLEGTAISCDTTCALKERAERLKKAFGVSNQEKDARIESLPYSREVLKTADVQLKWCLQVEGIMKGFMDNATRSSMFFKPMKHGQRTFVHELAGCYGLLSESQDPEPHRSVYVVKKPSSAASTMSLIEAVSTYRACLNQTVKLPVKAEEAHEVHYNAILVLGCLEGVTRDAIDDAVRAVFLNHGLLHGLQWLAKFKYLVIPEAFMRSNPAKERSLLDIAIKLKGLCKERLLAQDVKLARIDVEYLVVDEMEVEDEIELEKKKDTIEQDAKAQEAEGPEEVEEDEGTHSGIETPGETSLDTLDDTLALSPEQSSEQSSEQTPDNSSEQIPTPDSKLEMSDTEVNTEEPVGTGQSMLQVEELSINGSPY